MFSRYHVETTVQSLYCYPDSNVLKNKLGIHDAEELKEAEARITSVKQLILLQSPIKGRFSKTHLLRLHKFLFEDIYPFAGRLRREQISKGNTIFYPPNLIDSELKKVFAEIHSRNMLKERDELIQIQNLSYVMAGLNIIHPFREGNGRTIRELIRCMALENGIHLNWGNVRREDLLASAFASANDDMAFCGVLRSAKSDGTL